MIDKEARERDPDKTSKRYLERGLSVELRRKLIESMDTEASETVRSAALLLISETYFVTVDLSVLSSN